MFIKYLPWADPVALCAAHGFGGFRHYAMIPSRMGLSPPRGFFEVRSGKVKKQFFHLPGLDS